MCSSWSTMNFSQVLSILLLILKSYAEMITYLSVERANITYFNPKYFAFANMSSRRYSRKDPVYYFNLNLKSLFYADNKLKIDFYFYEWLTNVYKPTFVEMHFKWCDLIHKDKFFGAAMRQGKLAAPCPHPPDDYNLYNMTVSPAAIPRTFPFTKGRIYCNLTYPSKKDWVGFGYIDMELKRMKKN